MKIRRKPSKTVSRPKRPLYLIGYTALPASLPHVQAWFDLEYGGPLRVTAGPAGGVIASHGPWSAAITTDLAADDVRAWNAGLSWSHESMGAVTPSSLTPAEARDTVLHAARLARGLTLLTEGTAFDLSTGSYLNPSDWQDRSLGAFAVEDHVIVQQGDSDRVGSDWFHTLGLSKFGRDELEVYTPIGLPDRALRERVLAIADAVLSLGQLPRVGESTRLDELGLRLSALRHRTLPLVGAPVALREIRWEPIGP